MLPRLTARFAGALYFLGVLTAVSNEFVAHGKLGLLGILIPVGCQIGVTLLLYVVFEPVSRSLALLAACFQFVTLTCEAFHLQPLGMNIGMAFHGVYCLLMGYLMVRSGFLPRILSLLMIFAGLVWLVYLSPPLAKLITPYNTACGLGGEALPMLWLLAAGVNPQRWREQPRAAGGERTQRALRS